MQSFGEWVALPDDATSHQSMHLSAGQLAQFWRRCSRSADFWSAYSALFVPPHVEPGRLRRQDVVHVLSYMLNEMFENWAKFSRGPDLRTTYRAWIYADSLIFQFDNPLDHAGAEAFAQFLHELLAGDPEELYFQRLEAAAESGDSGSGLGYLTLIKDYGVQFAFRLRPANATTIFAEIQARVSLTEV